MSLPHRVLRAIRMWQAENQRTWRSQFHNLLDASALENIREQYHRQYGENLPYAVLVAKAVSIAMREFLPEHPELNAYLHRGILGYRAHYFDRLSFGCTFSVNNPEGYEQIVIAVCEDPDQKDLREINAALREKFLPTSPTVKNSSLYYRLPWILQKILAWYGENNAKARFLYRGTYSYTALGKFGIDYHDVPQSSTLTFGMGQVKERVFAKDGRPYVAPGFYLIMSLDRRLMNGQVPAEFLARVSDLLERGDSQLTASRGSALPSPTVNSDENRRDDHQHDIR
jgi:pyruvate/2-oxoglutarate dehydrogenase complex dihydrolipoamide acyltransferase (E2) component